MTTTDWIGIVAILFLAVVLCLYLFVATVVRTYCPYCKSYHTVRVVDNGFNGYEIWTEYKCAKKNLRFTNVRARKV